MAEKSILRHPLASSIATGIICLIGGALSQGLLFTEKVNQLRLDVDTGKAARIAFQKSQEEAHSDITFQLRRMNDMLIDVLKRLPRVNHESKASERTGESEDLSSAVIGKSPGG